MDIRLMQGMDKKHFCLMIYSLTALYLVSPQQQQQQQQNPPNKSIIVAEIDEGLLSSTAIPELKNKSISSTHEIVEFMFYVK